MQYHDNPYPSQRRVTFGRRGMVATSQQLAAQAGLDILKKGGNAVDAAVAAAACLTVVEPCSNGLGGDAFAHVWTKDGLFSLNSTGCCPALLDAQTVRDAGYAKMPSTGFFPQTVPGIPGAWAELSRRFGRLPFEELLALLYLGVKNIHLGPTLPAFLSPNVAKVLVENFGISGIGTVEDDMKLFFGEG